MYHMLKFTPAMEADPGDGRVCDAGSAGEERQRG